MLNFISTPIGNLNDISLRSIDVIRSSDFLYAEDTRNIKRLLKFINIKKKCQSFHEHNEKIVLKKIIKELQDKKNISIVSDAGTPAISDPGFKLIQECINNNIDFTLIPGPSSVISAVVMSGFPTNAFAFYGFLSKKISEQKNFFNKLRNDSKTSVFFESARRIEKTLNVMKEIFGNQKEISLCKEMTKIHESIYRGSIENIIQMIGKEEIVLKGEFVIVIGGSSSIENKFVLKESVKREFLSKLSVSDSAKLISLLSGVNKRDIYKKLID